MSMHSWATAEVITIIGSQLSPEGAADAVRLLRVRADASDDIDAKFFRTSASALEQYFAETLAGGA